MAYFENRLVTDYANFDSDMDYLKNVTTESWAKVKDFASRLNLASERQSEVKQKFKSVTNSMEKRFKEMNERYDSMSTKLKTAEIASYVNIAVGVVGGAVSIGGSVGTFSKAGLKTLKYVNMATAATNVASGALTGGISAIMMKTARDDVKYLKSATVRITCIEIKDLNIN